MKSRYDDGSQEWLDQVARARIRREPIGQQDQNGLSQYRKLFGQEIDINQVQDPELKRQLLNAKEAGLSAREHYTNSPHFGPAHLGGKVVDRNTAMNYEIDGDMDAFSNGINARYSQIRQQVNEADNTETQLQMLQPQFRGRAMQALTALQNGQRGFNGSLINLNEVNFNRPQQQMQNNNNNFQSCRLLNGYPCFRAMNSQGFGNTLVMARALGQINEQLSRHEFVVKGMVNVYIVQPQETMVDVSRIHPHMLTQLVEIMPPPMSGIQGNLLVQKEALGISGGNGYGRQVITDSRQQPRTTNNNLALQGRQLLTNGSRLLKG